MVNKQLLRAARNLRKKGPFLRGLLGDFSGNVAVSGRPGYFYVRVEKPGGYEVGIFPGRVRALNNLPVRIETHPVTGVQFIAGADDETIAYGGTDPGSIPAMELHGITHGWGGDDMLMWLHTMQIFPMRCQPHETVNTSVVIQAGTYYSEGVFCVLAAPLTVALSSYVPSVGHKYILLYLDSAGVAGVQDDNAQLLADLEPAPAGTFWVAAIRLAAGAGIGWQSIIDLRFLNSGVVNGGELELGTDYIVVGTGHPDAGYWTRIGTQLNALLDLTSGTGMMTRRAVSEVRAFFGVERPAFDEFRALIAWGSDPTDYLYFDAYDQTADAKTNVAYLTPAGVLWLLSNIELEAGATVDGVDVSSHDHSGAGQGGTIEFLNLGDTPSAYTGMAGRVPTVKLDETGMEFLAGGGGGATVYPIHRWYVDGALSVVDEAAGIWIVQDTFIPAYVWLYCQDPGSAGSTIIDIEKSTSNGAGWSSIFDSGGDYPELAYSAGHVASGAPDAVPLYAGTLLRLNITQVATGASSVSVQFSPVDIQPAGGLMTIMGIG